MVVAECMSTMHIGNPDLASIQPHENKFTSDSAMRSEISKCVPSADDEWNRVCHGLKMNSTIYEYSQLKEFLIEDVR